MVKDNIPSDSTIFTDEFLAYRGLSSLYKHDFCIHSEGRYVKTGLYGKAHTNTMEGFWSLLKRGVIGVYHYMSKKHLQRYLDEFCYRYNRLDKYDVKHYLDDVIKQKGSLYYKELIKEV